jgi:hypothetical protein
VSETCDAIQKGDVDTVWQRTSKADRAKFTSALGVSEEGEAKQTLSEALSRQTFHRFALGETKREGNTATVNLTTFKTENDADGETHAITLIQENGKWVLNGN